MKKKFRKILISLLVSACIAAACALTGCGGTYVPPSPPSDGSGGNGSGGNGSTGKDNDFTVSLVYNDKPFTQTDGVTVYWTNKDGFSSPVSSEIGKDGLARTKGLNGEYRITLEGLPKNYTYDPNEHSANNYNRHVDVEIYDIITIKNVPGQDGATVQNAKKILSEGAYKITIPRAGYTCYYMFAPPMQGTYAVRSLVNIYDNLINPLYRECWGTEFGMRYTGDLINGSGTGSTYTVNFDERSDFDETNIGGVMLFGVSGETRTLGYPFEFEFLLKRVDDYAYDNTDAPIKEPEEFAAFSAKKKAYINARDSLKAEFESGKISTSEYVRRNEEITRQKRELDNEMVAFADEKDFFMRATGSTFVPFKGYLDVTKVGFNENDGYYHMLNSTGKPEGAVVCARINTDIGIGTTFTTVEYQGNKNLTIDDNFERYSKNFYPDIVSPYDDTDYHFINYKVFIEGFDNIASYESAFPGISDQFRPYEYICSYNEFANRDGVYPVNKELYRFLQGYCVQQRLFNDGAGYAEGNGDEGGGYSASERSQWMLACGYYA